MFLNSNHTLLWSLRGVKTHPPNYKPFLCYYYLTIKSLNSSFEEIKIDVRWVFFSNFGYKE